MSEDHDHPTPQAGAPPSPLDELLETAEAAPKASLLEKVRGVGRGIFEKYGVEYKAGRGRPRLDGEPKSSDVPLNAPASALPVGGAPGSPLDHPPGSSGVVRRCYKALAKAFAGWADKIIFRKVVELSGDKAYAKEVVVEISLTDPEAEAFGELVEELSAMWGADEKFMALAASICTVTAVGGRYYMVNKDLDRQLKDRARRQHPAGGVKP